MLETPLNAWQGRVCQAIGVAFALAALFRVAMILVAAFAPKLLATTISCKPEGCLMESTLVASLPDDLRLAAEGIPNVQAILVSHLAEPAVRFKMLVGQIVVDLPVIALLLSVAVGIYMLGRTRGRALAKAVPWLRRAAICALVSVFTIPLGQSIQTTVLAQGLEADTRFALSVDLGRLALNLLLALVALAVTWALSAGMRAEQDLSEIV